MLSRSELGGQASARVAAFPPALGALDRRPCRAAVWLWLLMVAVPLCWGYSPLTHEQLVDILWEDQIQPLLLQRYPSATAEQLQRAHAYAYGGSLIQDMGYYPFGNAFFSDLTHCVRTGNFVGNLLRDAADLDQYAFALGALSHYAGDSVGHPFINRATALDHPKLRAKYGPSVTFADDRKAHARTEFGFDITQVAKHRFTSDRYHDFIGFEVSEPLLEEAFFETYGLRLEDALGNVGLALGTFRRAVSQVIPEMTRAALTTYHAELVKDRPGFSKELFLYNLSRAQYEKQWGEEYRRPGFFTRVLGLLVHVLPKVGVFNALAFKRPTPQTEELYAESVNRTVADYRRLAGEVSQGRLQFPNLDCDTGRPAAPGEYKLTDEAYARLLETLIKTGLDGVPSDVRADILTFFAAAEGHARTRKQREAWQRTAEELEALRAGPGSAIAAEVRARLLARLPKLQSPKARDS